MFPGSDPQAEQMQNIHESGPVMPEQQQQQVGQQNLSSDPSVQEGSVQEQQQQQDPEEHDGIRFSWNMIPRSKTDFIVPVGCMYTPLKEIQDMPSVSYSPVQCKHCRAILNPFGAVDFGGKLWTCPFCLSRNLFPVQYGEMTETNLPVELVPQFTTMEYVISDRPAHPPVFLFLLDTCLAQEEFEAMKESLILSLSLLPKTAVVGLLSVGKMINVFELSNSISNAFSKIFVLKGDTDYTLEKVSQLLKFTHHPPGSVGAKPGHRDMSAILSGARFFLPLSECEDHLTSLIEEMIPDPFPVLADTRPLRCTGAAFSVAEKLLRLSFPEKVGGRVVALIGGPCTRGPGQIVVPDLKKPIRSHHDLQKDTNVKYHHSSRLFYENLAKSSAEAGIAFDIISCALDQVGLYEIIILVDRCGGLAVQAASFQSPVFKQSMSKMLSSTTSTATTTNTETLSNGTNVTIELIPSRDLRIMGCIGPVSSGNKVSNSVAEAQIGIGHTSVWKMCEIDPRLTLAFFLEPAISSAASLAALHAASTSASLSLLQIITTYTAGDGFAHIRVTTVARHNVDPLVDLGSLSAGFDQECAAVLVARIASERAKLKRERSQEVMRWLDKGLIQLVSKFATYEKGQPDTFNVSPQFSFYPQFMFHLRRSPFLQVFNYSPDETGFQRSLLNRANTHDSLLMIQPTLFSYNFGGPPEPALLDMESIHPDRLLLLDTFFRVIVFHGEAIAQWRRQGIQDQPEHSNFKELLEAPKGDARVIVRNRLPVPTYIECDQHDSQSRFVVCVLNPSITHQTGQQVQGGEVVFTDDVSLQVFMDHLKKISVQQQ